MPSTIEKLVMHPKKLSFQTRSSHKEVAMINSNLGLILHEDWDLMKTQSRSRKKKSRKRKTEKKQKKNSKRKKK